MHRVVVIGGGYAGLASLIELSGRGQQLELHLIDAHSKHCKITNLHKTFAKPVEDFMVPYALLAERFSFTFHQHRLDLSEEDLIRLQEEKVLPLPDGEIAFDWLIMSTGASPPKVPGRENLLVQEDLRRGRAKAALSALSGQAETQDVQVSLVGGGATGLQILFELQALLKSENVAHTLRLVDLNKRLVPDLPEGVHRYILKKLCREGIDYLPETRYLGQEDQKIHLQESDGERDWFTPSHLTLFCPGVTPDLPLQASPYGQIKIKEQVLTTIFAAGDCSHFNSSGLNTLTAQAAVRKGKLVARNILNLCRGASLQKYSYQEKGYLLSLGPAEAVGWLGVRGNLVKGFAAIVLKEAMETQYDMFLRGVDTYLGFP